MKHKICIVTTKFPQKDWGGLARSAERVALYAADFGLDVHVAHLVTEENSHILLDENRETVLRDSMTVHTIRAGKEFFSDKRKLGDCPHTLTLQMMYHSLEKLHIEEHFDMFHAFFLFPSGYISGLLSKRFNVKSIVTLAGNDINKYLFSSEKVAPCRTGLENADRIVALSHDLLDKASCIADIKHKGTVIYNSVLIPPCRWKEQENKIFTVGCAGIFKYAKGLPYLFKALGEVAKKENISLHLAGKVREEEKENFDKMVKDTGIEPHFTHSIPHEKINDWLLTLNLFVLPSLTEGCPNILMEAMAAGLPCIATRTGANEVLVEDGISGLLVPRGDSKALERAIFEVINNSSLRKSLGEKAREKMKAFSPEKEKKAWEILYRELIDF
ncbi:MAG: glycosyltransferase [Candidatus Eremiobacterota bacterium]